MISELLFSTTSTIQALYIWTNTSIKNWRIPDPKRPTMIKNPQQSTAIHNGPQTSKESLQQSKTTKKNLQQHKKTVETNNTYGSCTCASYRNVETFPALVYNLFYNLFLSSLGVTSNANKLKGR